MNTIAPAQPQASKANDASAPADGQNSFNQVLSREMADRKSVDQPAKAKEPEAKSSNKPASSGNTQEAKSASDADDAASAAESDTADTDAQTDAASAANDMLALVASLNQANPAAQAAQQAATVDTTGAVVAKDATVAVDGVVSTGKADSKGTIDLRGRVVADAKASATPDAKAQVASPALAATGDARTAPTDAKPDAASDFSRALERANTPADAKATDAADTKPVEVATPQVKPGQEIVAKAKEAIAAAAKPEQSLDIKELPAAPSALQLQQQPAVNNLTHLAASQVSETLAPRVGTPAWDQALGQKVTWMIAGEQQSASLTLNPPDLGPLQVVLNVTNSQANATFVAAQPEVRQALESAMPRLRDMLADAGIQLGQATVSSGSNGQQQGTFEQQQSPSGARRMEVSSVRFDTPVQTGRVATGSSGQGLVDTFV